MMLVRAEVPVEPETDVRTLIGMMHEITLLGSPREGVIHEADPLFDEDGVQYAAVLRVRIS